MENMKEYLLRDDVMTFLTAGFYWNLFDLHCKENVFLFWEFRGLSPNFHIHVSVSDLYIPMIGPHISLQKKRQADPGII